MTPQPSAAFLDALRRADEGEGVDLSSEAVAALAEAEEDIQAGRVYTTEQIIAEMDWGADDT